MGVGGGHQKWDKVPPILVLFFGRLPLAPGLNPYLLERPYFTLTTISRNCVIADVAFLLKESHQRQGHGLQDVKPDLQGVCHEGPGAGELSAK